jgi:TPR repeat protein
MQTHIVTPEVDAIFAGATHRAAGPALLAECLFHGRHVKRSLSLVHVVLALLLAPGAAHAQSLDMALAALKRGDHATALKLLPPLAEQGNAAAQFNLGLIYDNGRGVARNHAGALKWYRLAAIQGNAGA